MWLLTRRRAPPSLFCTLIHRELLQVLFLFYFLESLGVLSRALARVRSRVSVLFYDVVKSRPLFGDLALRLGAGEHEFTGPKHEQHEFGHAVSKHQTRELASLPRTGIGSLAQHLLNEKRVPHVHAGHYILYIKVYEGEPLVAEPVEHANVFSTGEQRLQRRPASRDDELSRSEGQGRASKSLPFFSANTRRGKTRGLKLAGVALAKMS